MSSNVVLSICQASARQKIAAFRFNFRGVGGSEGSFGEGVGEQADVKAALDFVSSSPNIDSTKIGLAGYSFGGGVALAVAVQDERVRQLALVSPALTEPGWEQLKIYTKPRLLIIGDADSYIPLKRFEQRLKDIPEPRQYHVVAGADHFWLGYEAELAQKVTQFFVKGFA